MTQTTKGNFIGMLLHARDYMYLAAFQSTGIGSGRRFTTLMESSDKLSELCKRFIKGTQGEEGFIEISIPSTKYDENLEEFLVALKTYIENLGGIFLVSWQKKLINELSELIASTIYEIKYLK